MRTKFIVRATPTLGSISVWWAKAVEDILWPMNYAKAVMYIEDDIGGKIAESRNQIIARCFQVEDTHEVAAILWIDDDVIPTAGVLMQLIQHLEKNDIATGVYFTKHHFCEPLLWPALGGGTLKYEPASNGEQKAAEVWMGSMGLSLVRMDLLRCMARELKLPRDDNGNLEFYRTTKGRAEDVTVEQGIVHCGGTEDAHFMMQAHKVGVRCVADFTKYAFGFHYDGRNRIGYPESQWKQRQSGKPITWETSQGTVSWE